MNKNIALRKYFGTVVQSMVISENLGVLIESIRSMNQLVAV